MEFEYNFKIKKTDIDNLSQSPDGIDTIDKFLRAAPCFVDKTDSTYSYSEEPENKHRWPSTVCLQDDGFNLCPLYLRQIFCLKGYGTA